MNSDLPATGTAALLELLDPFVPDQLFSNAYSTCRSSKTDPPGFAPGALAFRTA